MRILKSPVRSLSEFLDIVEKIISKWTQPQYFAPWFRGVGRASHNLVPSLYRRKTWSHVEEFNFRDDFRFRARQFLDGVGAIPATRWDWYFLMRHYGLPTRLLDWSESAIVAMYFAVNAKPSKENAAVWILDPWEINVQIARMEDVIFSGDYVEIQAYLPQDHQVRLPAPPIAIRAPHDTKRITAQKGYFTLHGSDRQGLDQYPQIAFSLLKIEVARAAITTIRRQLAAVGITETTLFPELPTLAHELTLYWTGK